MRLDDPAFDAGDAKAREALLLEALRRQVAFARARAPFWRERLPAAGGDDARRRPRPPADPVERGAPGAAAGRAAAGRASVGPAGVPMDERHQRAADGVLLEPHRLGRPGGRDGAHAGAAGAAAAPDRL